MKTFNNRLTSSPTWKKKFAFGLKNYTQSLNNYNLMMVQISNKEILNRFIPVKSLLVSCTYKLKLKIGKNYKTILLFQYT